MIDMQSIPLLQETLDLQKEIAEKRKKLNELRLSRPPEPVLDYQLRNWSGGTEALSALFGEGSDLIIIHNMGKRCVYCSLWADGFNGVHQHISDRAPFVVVSPDAPEVQEEFAKSRGWNFKMLSGDGSEFIKDMGFVDKEDGSYWPGVSSFHKDESGQIFRVTADIFGPGDAYCSVWHFLDLLKDGAGKWGPKYKY